MNQQSQSVGRPHGGLLMLAALFAAIVGFGGALFGGVSGAHAIVGPAPYISNEPGACAQGVYGWTFHFVGHNITEGNGGTLSVDYFYPPSNQKHTTQQAEANNNDGVADWFVTIPFNGNSSIFVNHATNGEIGWNGEAVASSTACPQGGSILVKKVVTNVVNDPTLFDGNVDGGSDFTFSELAGSSFIPVSAGAHTVNELPKAGYTTLGWAYMGEVCPQSPTHFTPSADVSVSAGNTVVVCFYNEKNSLQIGRHVTICKVVDNNGDQADDGGIFHFDVSYSNSTVPVAITAHESDGANGVCTTISVPLDFKVTVTELLNQLPNGWNSPAGYPKVKVDNGQLQSGNVADLGYQGKVALFVNRTTPATGSISVTKQTTLNGVSLPADDGGWAITVTSLKCAVNLVQVTVQGNPLGTTTFSNLPVCNDYVVSENAASKPGYLPVGPASYAGIAVTSNGTTTVAFVNNQVFVLPCLFSCNPQIPTPTPTTPPTTSTPPVKTATPPAQPTGTPIDVVLGEKTATNDKTPLAPNTGSGIADSTDDGAPIVFLAAGIIVIAAGVSVLGLAARRR